MSTAVSGATFKGTATNADALDGLDSTKFMLTESNTGTTGTLSVLNDTGIYFGGDNDGRLNVSGTDVYLQNQTQDGDIVLRVNDGGAQTTAITIDGATSIVNVNTSLVVTGNATAANFAGAGGSITALNASNLASGTVPTGRITGTYGTLTGTGALAAGSIASGFGTINISTNAVTAGSILNGNANGVGNIGSSAGYFNTVFAKATSAEYADLAERFASDAIYAPGTVVELGGSEEITICVDELSSKVFGVVSTQPAYTMNAGSGNNETHPAIAMTGRVPVMTMGFVTKGDRLVSAGNGAARAATLTEVTAFNVIGRALADKTTEGLGNVEAIVKIS
jgi:hypothetical protein